MPRVLVTGGAGFIGRHLVEALALRDAMVRVLDIEAPCGLPPCVEFVHGSIGDRGVVEQALRGVDCVYHLAGIAHLWRPEEDEFDRVNRRGTETTLQAAAKARVGRFVHCSTESILLPRKRNGHALIDESAVPVLADMPGPYTRSKFLAERAALEAARNGLNLVVVNPTVPIGEGDRNMTPPAAMFALFLSGGSPFFLECMLNLVDVRDLAEGIVQAGERGRAGERYILGGENMALGELLPVLERLSGQRMPRHAIPASLARVTGLVAGFIADHVTRTPPVTTREAVDIALRSAPFDSRKAREELGYAPRPIAPALTEVVKAFKSEAGRGLD
jgi:dihydroflavonol-4-reductase